MRFGFFLILLFIFNISVKAQNVYEFLRLDTNPRAAALAGSFVSNADDPNVMFYNPAGIKTLKKTPVSFSFLKHLMDINSASIVGSYYFEGIGRFGAGIQYINYGSFTAADQFGTKTGEFGAGDFAFTVGYSNSLGENFNYGANVKFIYSGIADYSSSGLAFDLGLQYLIPESNWVFGFSALNIGSQISSYVNTKEALPLDVKLGVSKKLAHLPLTFYFAVNRLNEDQNSFFERFKQVTFGAEINLSKTIDIRLGYDNEKRADLKLGTSAGLAGFHVGFGVKVKEYKIDYAFSSMGSVGSLHRFGVTTSF